MSMFGDHLVLTTLLTAQLLYCVLGVGYNLLSYAKAATGGRQLSSTSPIFGTVFMLLYGLCLLFGYLEIYVLYRVLMSIFVVLVGYSGIIKHIMVYNQQPDAYSSQLAWATAIGINGYGLLLNVLAATGRFQTISAN